MQAFARELQSMASRLERLSAGTSQRPSRGSGRSRRRRGRGANSTPGAETTPTQPSLSINQGRGRRRGRGARVNGPTRVSYSTGDVVISKAELITTLKIPANKSQLCGHIDIIPDSFPWMKKFFSSFDKIRYESVRFYWKPLVGTVYGGAISMGMDWDWSNDDSDRSKISGYSPSVTCALFEDGERKYQLILPKSRLMTRAWYIPRASSFEDKGPGKVHYCVDGKTDKTEQTVGDIWVRYTVVMSGTNPA